ncbi:hypothetical protein, partial [Bacillus velezensis]|uniref:hypothetical protein n=1 Tax=Bacillus velezensis TaxID=492670 RepID=UPI0011A1D2FD
MKGEIGEIYVMIFVSLAVLEKRRKPVGMGKRRKIILGGMNKRVGRRKVGGGKKVNRGRRIVT